MTQQPNAVEAFLTRLELKEYAPAFAQAGVTRTAAFRNLGEDKLKALIPDASKRQKLVDAMTRNAQPGGEGGGARMGPPAIAPPQGPMPIASFSNEPQNTEPRSSQRVCRYYRTPQGCRKGDQCPLAHVDGAVVPQEGAPAPRPKKPCRDFFNDGCKFGNDCRFSHEADAEHAAGVVHNSGETLNSESYWEEIVVPYESVKLLLANKAEKLNRINVMCGTTNQRIEKPESYMQTFTIKVRGSKEGVAHARDEIEHLVGIKASQVKEARFQYFSHELDRNLTTARYLVACNTRNQGSSTFLSDKALRDIVDTFRFPRPQNVSQWWSLSLPIDKDKFEVVQKAVKPLKAVQAIVFTDADRVKEMAKRSGQTANAFGVKNPQFVHPGLSKEERMKALEIFKEGEVNESGLRQRLLVTTNDYARLAHKVSIPYVNAVFHFAIPKTKEFYNFQTTCTGRGGAPGISMLFITNNDVSVHREWSEVLPLHEYNELSWEKACADLVYDGVANPLNPPDAEPQANWRDVMAKEAAEKAAQKAAYNATKKKTAP